MNKNYQKLKEKQDKEFDKEFAIAGSFFADKMFIMGWVECKKQSKKFLDKVRKETCEAKDKEYAGFAEKMNTALFEVEKRVIKETAKMVCDKMIGKPYLREHPFSEQLDADEVGYNIRIKEEKEIKSQIIKKCQ